MIFDPYQQWFGIEPRERPVNHYRLLGVPLFESNAGVIEAAVEQRVSFLQDVSTGPQVKASQQLINEVVAARLCLVDKEKKTAYDAQLRAAINDQKKASSQVKSQAELHAPAHGKRPLNGKTIPQKQQAAPRLKRAKRLENVSPTPPPLGAVGPPRIANTPIPLDRESSRGSPVPVAIQKQTTGSYVPSRIRGSARRTNHRTSHRTASQRFANRRSNSTWVWWAIGGGGFVLAVMIAILAQISGDSQHAQVSVAGVRLSGSNAPRPTVHALPRKESTQPTAQLRSQRQTPAKPKILAKPKIGVKPKPQAKPVNSDVHVARRQQRHHAPSVSPKPPPALRTTPALSPPDALRSTPKAQHSLTSANRTDTARRNSKIVKEQQKFVAEQQKIANRLVASLVLWLDASHAKAFDKEAIESGAVRFWRDRRAEGLQLFAQSKSKNLPQRMSDQLMSENAPDNALGIPSGMGATVSFVRFQPGNTMEIPALENVDFQNGFTLVFVARGRGILLQYGFLNQNGFAIQGNITTLRVGSEIEVAAEDHQLDEFKIRMLVVDRKAATWYFDSKRMREEFPTSTILGKGKFHLGGTPRRWNRKAGPNPIIDVGDLAVFNRPLEPTELRLIHQALQGKWFGASNLKRLSNLKPANGRRGKRNGAQLPFGDAEPRRPVTKTVID